MRFSLKWPLAGMVYAAIAAAAFARPHWASACVVWIITFFAVVYALIVALSARGPRRIVALGFAVASVLFFLCLRFAPNYVPIDNLVDTMYPMQQLDPIFVDRVTILRRTQMPNPGPEPNDPVYRIRAASAVTTMLAGLAGSALGVVAYRRGRDAES